MKLIIQVFMLLWLCVLAVEANAALKGRIRTMERRMNTLEMRVITDNDMTNTMFDSLHQDVDTLNGSFISLKNEVCLKNEIEVDNDDNEKTHISTEIKSFSSLSNRLLSLGFAKEKKWIREEIQTLTHGVADEKERLREDVQTLTLGIANEKERLNKEVQALSQGIANENERLKEEVQTFIQEINEQSDRVDNRISEFKNVLKDHEVTINIKLNTHMEAVDAKMQKHLKKINQSVIDLEQNLGNNLPAVISEVSVIKTQTIQSLEEEIKRNTEIIKEQKLNIDILTEKLDILFSDCPYGWTRNDLFCYFYVNERKTYDGARETCSSRGANVADIQSKQENDFIVNFCKEKGHFLKLNALWIGFTYEGTENVWISDRTGARASYTNWRTGQPYGGTGQQCVVLGFLNPREQWNDLECSDSYMFVCKR